MIKCSEKLKDFSKEGLKYFLSYEENYNNWYCLDFR